MGHTKVGRPTRHRAPEWFFHFWYFQSRIKHDIFLQVWFNWNIFQVQTNLIFHLSFLASLCSWHLWILFFKNTGVSRFKFTLILDLTDSPNLNYPAYQKNAHSLLNLNKCKSESWIPTCLVDLIFIVFFQDCIDLEP